MRPPRSLPSRLALLLLSKHPAPPLALPLHTRWLWLALQAGQTATVAFSPYQPSPRPYDDVASYSSFGPTLDGRIKPDIVAPGVEFVWGRCGICVEQAWMRDAGFWAEEWLWRRIGGLVAFGT